MDAPSGASICFWTRARTQLLAGSRTSDVLAFAEHGFSKKPIYPKTCQGGKIARTHLTLCKHAKYKVGFFAGCPRPICYSGYIDKVKGAAHRSRLSCFRGRISGIDERLAAFSHAQAAWRMGGTPIHGHRLAARLSRPQALGRLARIRCRNRARRPLDPRAGKIHHRPQRHRIFLPVPPQLSDQKALLPPRTTTSSPPTSSRKMSGTRSPPS